jgi:hypothetical protein
MMKIPKESKPIERKKRRTKKQNKFRKQATSELASICESTRTYTKIGRSYCEVSQGQAYKIIRWVEESLIKSGKFTVGGKKELAKGSERRKNNDSRCYRK